MSICPFCNQDTAICFRSRCGEDDPISQEEIDANEGDILSDIDKES